MRFLPLSYACALAALACGTPAETPEGFPAVPADGPLPEIGPAPADYRPTAAGSPSTDIWVGSISGSGASMSVEGLTNATDRPGYDNQPAFTEDGASFLYVSAVDTTQTEVFRYSLETGSAERLTQTPGVSEFSPTPIPGQEAFSAIHETRGKQYLWRYGLDGSELGPIFSTVEPVGYHAWADDRVAVMFVLGRPPTLQVGDAIGGEVKVVTESPGRSIHRIPGTHAISFVRKVADEEWWIERLDPTSGETSRLIRTLPGREDYAWLPDGQIVMGDGTELYVWMGEGDWTEFQQLGSHGLGAISRLAVNADGSRIAIVANRPE